MTDRGDAMPVRFYRDPLDILIGMENRTCKGCAHVGLAFNAAYCEKGKQYGRRCNFYSEGDGGKS